MIPDEWIGTPLGAVRIITDERMPTGTFIVASGSSAVAAISTEDGWRIVDLTPTPPQPTDGPGCPGGSAAVG